MKIAVLSDTHDHLHPDVAAQCVGKDEIWHLGDVTAPSVLDTLRAIGLPLRIVRGNCDYNADWPMTQDLTIKGLKLHLIHIPPYSPPSGADIVLHGHTHVPRNEVMGSCRFLNPGTAGGPTRGAGHSMAILTLDEDDLTWEVIAL